MHKLTYQYLDPEEIIGSSEFRIVESFLQLSGRTEIGWHYIVDLTWIYEQAKDWPIGLDVLDAGGGTGPVQFLLVEMGMNVVNVDLAHKTESSPFVDRYCVKDKSLDSYQETDYVRHLSSLAVGRPSLTRVKKWLAKSAYVRKVRSRRYRYWHECWRSRAGVSDRPIGRLARVSGNLCYMPEVPSCSFDAVVSLSALEHIPMAKLPAALSEIDRVLKPGGYRAVTTSGAEGATWYHVPSKGLCFSRCDLERVFNAKLVGSADPKAILEKYRTASYLQEHLAGFYKKSSTNGMPCGRWAPQYVPVGIRA